MRRRRVRVQPNTAKFVMAMKWRSPDKDKRDGMKPLNLVAARICVQTQALSSCVRFPDGLPPPCDPTMQGRLLSSFFLFSSGLL